jgi:hypothetical protein
MLIFFSLSIPMLGLGGRKGEICLFFTYELKVDRYVFLCVRTDSGMVVAKPSESVYLSCKRKSCVGGARQSHSDAFVSIILSVYYS